METPGQLSAEINKQKLGTSADVYLIRPDGYVGLAADRRGATRALEAYAKRWFKQASYQGADR